MNMYRGAGANTTDFVSSTKLQQLNAGTYLGNPYLPDQRPIVKVQKTLSNPRGYLSNTKGMKKVSGSTPAWNYLHNGSKNLSFGSKKKRNRRKFGSFHDSGRLLYTRDNLIDGNTLYQPRPVYMQGRLQSVKGDYLAFGKKKKRKTPFSVRSFGRAGKSVTLSGNGKISVT